MRESGINRYQKNAARTRHHNQESQTPVGRRLLTESVGRLSEEIKIWKKEVEKHPVGARSAAFPYIDLLSTDVVAALAARSVINSISMHEKLTKAAFKVARVIEDECRWRELYDKNPSVFMRQREMVKKIPSYNAKRRFLNNAERRVELNFSRWPRNEKLKVGIVLIELMKQSTGIIEINTRTGLLGKRDTFVHPTPELMEWMKYAHNFAEDLSPMYMPCVERPAPWKDVYTGGFLTEHIAPRPLVKTRDRGHLEDLDAMGIQSTKDTINILQDVAWEIDEWFLDVLLYCWENEIEVGDLPPASGHPIPTKPVDIDTNKESRRRWAKAAARINHQNASDKSKRLQITKVLWLAKKFRGLWIWFVWYCDFRGRKYQRQHFLTPHSFEEASTLLRFAVGKAVGNGDGGNWLARHGAAVYGIDKCSYDEREQWTHSNRDMIEAVANDPRGTTSLWGKADKPWKFLAFCNEWAGYMRHGSSFVTKLPVSIDGSSNGLQLYSLLMRDPVGAAATNVLPSGQPRDIYGDVARGVLSRLSVSDHPYAATWLKFGVDRTCCKRPTMVVPYSATMHACIQYTIDWFHEERRKKKRDNPFGWEETYQPCSYLAGIIWESIGDVVGEARKAMAWLQEISNICIDNGVAPRWTSPSGFLVKQTYEKWKNQSVRTIIGDVIRQHRVRSGTGDLSKAKHRNGIAANWIHTLDQTIAELTHQKNKKAGIVSQSSTHDGFETLAPDMSIMQANLLESVIEIFSEDLMENFANEITQYLPKGTVLPEPPARGTLDIHQVRDSLYFYG